jgi:hypothetical protein
VPEFRGRKRVVMTPGHYTELFLLDEGTALSPAAKALGIGFLGLAAGDKAGRLEEEGASCVLPDISDPVRVGECPEAVARRPPRRRQP